MIFEIRTYDLKPHTSTEFEKRFGAAYEYRKAYSPLTAMWRVEVGPLDQMVHVWGYPDLARRAVVRDAALASGQWPPKTAEFISHQRSEVMIPLPFSPEILPGAYGPWFEMCIDTLANSADVRRAVPAWEKALPERLQFGRLFAAWRSEFGALNQFVHIWAYQSLDERARVKQELRSLGRWLPGGEGDPGYAILRQENKLLVPLSFSPVQ